MSTPDTLEVIAHLDWPVEPCENNRCEDGHPPATHVLRELLPCRCCPPELICTPCADRWREFLDRHKGQIGCLICLRCTRHYHADPALYLTITPL